MKPTSGDSSPERISRPEPGLRLAAHSGLDVMLNDAVLEDGGVGRFLKPRAAGRAIAGLTLHPRRAARDAGTLGRELGRVAAGRSAVAPAKGDRRFGDQAWRANWLLRRVMQSYLATGGANLVSETPLRTSTPRRLSLGPLRLTIQPRLRAQIPFRARAAHEHLLRG